MAKMPKEFRRQNSSWAWWYIPVIPAMERGVK
jgi:hypothetical protein